jgi:NAD(P)-dependent dehydrogenase (short-subunit alcohol dehydrogenase family)
MTLLNAVLNALSDSYPRDVLIELERPVSSGVKATRPIAADPPYLDGTNRFVKRAAMSKIIVIVGFGPGNSTAVAEKFGTKGFSVALVGRNEDRLVAGVSALKARGIAAAAFRADAADPTAIGAAIRQVRAELGPITAIHWNAFGGTEAGDLLTADPAALRGIFDVAIFGLLAATREALPDLKRAGDGTILITNGGFGELSPDIDANATSLNVMGIALANAAKNKLAGLLSQRLKGDGIYVGEAMVRSTIKGTPTGNGNSVEPSRIADKFWELYQSRGEMLAGVS